jgi:hypothetical protein
MATSEGNRLQASGFRLQTSGFSWRISARRDALGVCLLLRTKSQAPNYKQGPNSKTANSKRKQQRQTGASRCSL